MTATDVFAAIVFYVIAALMVFGGVAMIFTRNMVRSALWLVLALCGVAVMYILLSADFLAVGQLLVYVGAIMILMLFAIMLTPNQVDIPSAAPQAQRISAALTALMIFVIALYAVLVQPWNTRPIPLNVPTAESFGLLLMSDYVLPFWIASILLTAGMIGAIVIARED